MATLTEHKLSILTEFLSHHPQIPHATLQSPTYHSLHSCFIINDAINPPLIVRPPTATDVAALVAFMSAHYIPFTIRSGGHDLFGRSMASGAVTIDLRDIAHVHVDHSSRSARIGGGTITGDLAAHLAKEDLATAYGTIPTVGYVGWAIHGGYGILSPRYGLGVDQILGAKIVNASGELVEADGPMLKGIRGGGGTLGVIVELTIRVYPFEKRVLGGVILYRPDDIPSTIKQFNDGYRALSAEGLPRALTIQQAVVNSPTGKALSAFFMWSSPDVSAGEFWLGKFLALGPVSMNTVATTTLPDWLNMAGNFVPDRCYGSMFTIDMRRLTPAVANAIGRHAPRLPSESTSMLSIHEFRGSVGDGERPDSVFPAQEPHFMLEIFASAQSLSPIADSEQWAQELRQAVIEADPENVLPGVYLPFASPERFDGRQIFADQYQSLVDLKHAYDPRNVFQFALAQVTH